MTGITVSGPGRLRRVLAPVAAIAVLAALPLVMGAYPITLGSRILAFALLVVSVDILTGVTGLPTLGQAAYFGAGAYAAALVGIHWISSAVVQLLAGVLVATVLALGTGAVVVRTKGVVFLMVTLAVGELTHQVANSWSAVGGTNGLAGMPPISVLPSGPPLALSGFVYWWVLAVFVIGYLAVAYAMRSPFGRTLRGIRDNEPRLRALGLRTYPAKLAAYGMAGAVAGAAGTLWAAQARFVAPADLAFDVAAFALLSVVIGGAGTLWGPCLGAALVILVRDELSDYVDGRGPLLLGIVFVTCVYALPHLRKRLGRLRTRRREGAR